VLRICLFAVDLLRICVSTSVTPIRRRCGCLGGGVQTTVVDG
jgi:hypothetical protein